MERNPVLYFLIHVKSKRFYVGSTELPEKRYNRHMRDLRKGVHHNVFLQELYNDDPVLFMLTQKRDSRKQAYLDEKETLDRLKDSPMLVNIGLDSRGGDNITKHPKRTDILHRRVNSHLLYLSKMTDEERKEKYGRYGSDNGMFGKTHTVEVRDFISNLNKGRVPVNKGLPAPEHVRKILSDIAKLRIGEKNPFFGKKHSDETKGLIRSKKLGSVPGNRRKVVIDNVTYLSISHASKATGINSTTILHRTKNTNPKFSNYRFVD